MACGGISPDTSVAEDDADADEDEDESARDLHDLAEVHAQPTADLHAKESCGSGDEANHDGRVPYADPEKGERNTNREGVEACRHRQHEQAPTTGWVNAGLGGIIFDQSSMDGLQTDECQQGESDPVVIAGEGVHHRSAREPADDGHDRLKQAEVEG